MGEMTIQLRMNPETGKQDIVISLRSDEDLLPHEHENQHQALVDKLIEGGVLKASEAGKVVVQREEEKGVSAPQNETPSQQQGLSESG